jgi:SAM-dependent methyltransferase
MPTWDELYADPALLPVPDEPESFVTRALEGLAAPRATPVLDVGCGAGRHLLWLERHGFAAYGTDLAPNGLARTRDLLRHEGGSVRVALADMRELPFADGSFGAVIAHHVLYHGVTADVRRAIAEAGRVLRDEGVLVGTLLSTRAWKHGEGERLEPSTFRQERGPEAGVVHHYCDEVGARELLADFDVDGLALDEFSDDEGHRHSHWRFVAIWRNRGRPKRP